MKTESNNSLLHFDNFELDTEIRAITKDDQPYFVAKDVCQSLGLENTSRATESLDPDELVLLKVTAGGQNRSLQFVTESGLYALIFKSRKEAAKSFRKWVTSEVLPAIRRAGRYDPAEIAAQMVPSVRRAYLMAEVEELEARITILRKQADFAQVIPGQMTVWQWLLLQGEDPKGGHCGNLSSRCKRLADERGIRSGVAKVIDHCGQISRLSRTARTYPEEILIEICGQAA
jgi:prophage antirepressor-like protein